MRSAAVLAIIVALAACVPLCTADADASATETLSDGTSYTYTTYGSSHAEYRATIDSVSSDSTGVYISTTLEGYDVTAITAAELPNAVFVVIPECVATIAAGAFSSCASLADVYFLGDMPSIGSGAFPSSATYHRVSGTSGWSSSVQTISEATVENTDGSSVRYLLIEGEAMAFAVTPSSDGRVTIASEAGGLRVTSVGPYCMAGRDSSDGSYVVSRTDIVSVTVSEGVKVLRERSFYYCGGLTSVDLPDSLEVIMDEAFRAAANLVSVDIPDSVTYMGFESFRHCESLQSVDIPDSVAFIGEGTFKVCRSLETAAVGSGLDDIADYAFSYCSSLTSISFRGSLESVGIAAFEFCSSLVSVNLPDSVETIGYQAFLECTKLTSVGMGSSLVTLGAQAFHSCSALSGMTLPATLESVGDRAFAYCSSLTDIRFEGDMPEFGSNVFLNLDVTVHVTSAHSASWSSYTGNLVVDSDGIPMWAIVVAVLAVIAIAAVCFVIVRSRSEKL